MINNYKKIALSVAKGFTLIETLVAVLLLASAIAGPLTIAAKGLNTSLTAKDQVAAFYIAQDALEYVRFKRDTNKLSGGSWLNGIVGSGLCSADGATKCIVDSLQDTVTACMGTNGACPVLKYDSTNHYYSYTTGTVSPERYVRTVQITTPVGGNVSEAALQVTVAWTGAGGIVHSVVVRENLYDW
ncbi:MAG: prepilin-type N-terminal cleavage/methylation domain-containing protein [Patescibacteria group bacterium]